MKKKKPEATEEKRTTTPQKKRTLTWRPTGMALSSSGKTGRTDTVRRDESWTSTQNPVQLTQNLNVREPMCL